MVSITAGRLTVEADPESGKVSVVDADGNPRVVNGASRFTWTSGTLATTDEAVRVVQSSDVDDSRGAGARLTLRCSHSDTGIEIEASYTIYNEINAFFVDTIVRNTGVDPIDAVSIEPLVAASREHGAVYLPNTNSWRTSVLTNGYMFMDPGRVENLMLCNVIQSRWNLLLMSRETGEAFSAGYVSFEHSEGEVYIESDFRHQPIAGRFGVGLSSRSLFAPKCVINPGGELNSDQFAVNWDASTDGALMGYAKRIQSDYEIEPKTPLMGWCSWYYTYHDTSEDEILRNARFIAEHLKDYGLTYIQIDDGYQKAYGDWESNHKFPRGMKYLADEIKSLGLKPGLWVAPYSLATDGEIAEDHPEWLGRDLDGETKRVSDGYALDTTHPEARKWLNGLMSRITHDWGYEMVKIDFSYASLLEIDQFYDNTKGRAAAYRLGLQEIRDAVGDDVHILDCGPMTAVGIADSWRIEWDFDRLNWRQFTQEQESNAPAVARRYYLHNHLWSNDPDIIGLDLLNMDQARSVASLMSVSGGTIILGDKLYALPDAKLDLYKKILPAYGTAAQPLDLFDRDFPRLFHLPVRTDFGDWDVIALFNWSETDSLDTQLDVAQILSSDRDLVAFEFWDQEVRALDAEGTLRVNLAPGQCSVFAVRQLDTRPIVIGTDRHVLQGAVELESVAWDERDSVLSGTIHGVAGTSVTLTLWIPDGYQTSRDALPTAGIGVGELHNNLVSVRVDCTDTAVTPWSVRFTEA